MRNQVTVAVPVPVPALPFLVQNVAIGDQHVDDLVGIHGIRQEDQDVPSLPDLCEFAVVTFTKWSQG
jgi:hypothetical protein